MQSMQKLLHVGFLQHECIWWDVVSALNGVCAKIKNLHRPLFIFKIQKVKIQIMVLKVVLHFDFCWENIAYFTKTI